MLYCNLKVSAQAKNGLTAMHLCAQEDRVNVAEVLVQQNAAIDSPTKAGYTPLHVACHFGTFNTSLLLLFLIFFVFLFVCIIFNKIFFKVKSTWYGF